MTFKKVESSPSFPALEAKVLTRWKTEKTFERSVSNRKGRPEFIFYDGPPFPTGNPHHGTIFVSILKDAIPRYKTMRGHYVPRGWGWDCHGLPIETLAEKNLGITDKTEIERTIGVKAFNDECRRIVSQFNESWRTYIDKLGRWVDFDHPYSTLDRTFMESVLWVFAESYKKDLIYKDYRVNPYCYRCQTPLSVSDTRLDDATRPKQDRAITVKFRVKDAPDTYFLAWTTTPWTLPSNLALAVGNDIDYSYIRVNGETFVLASALVKAYAKEFGKDPEVVKVVKGAQLVSDALKYEPLFPYFKDRNPNGFRIVSGKFVSTDEGTGIVHMAPAFGEDDYWTCREYKIGVIAPVDDKGNYTAEVTDFAGKNVHEANPEVIKLLKSAGVVVRDTTIEHNYPHCWRCRTPLIYKAVDAWYFRVEAIKDRLLANNQKINWCPEVVRDGRFGKWLENARDWNISRNRFWATPVPVWECSSCKARDVFGSAAEIEAKAGRALPDLHKEHLDAVEYPCGCGHTMKHAPEVLDGWLESGAMPYGQFHYPFENAEHFRSHFPADFIVEYTGQIRGWFYYLHVLSTALFDRPAFQNCLVHGTLLADNGKKLSKSLKNYTDPMELMDKYGADALRGYLLSSSAVQLDDLLFRDDGIEGMVKSVMLPLWNSLSFFTTYAEIDGISSSDLTGSPSELALNELDRFILSETEILVRKVQEKMDAYAIHEAARLLPDFLDSLNNWYIRRSRDRVWAAEKKSKDKIACYTTLYRVLSRFTQVLSPFCPFIAESVWERLGNSESVHLTDWPEVDPSLINEELSSQFGTARAIITAGLAIRAREKIRVRQPLSRVRVVVDRTFDLAKYEDVIQEELNVKAIERIADTASIASRVGKADAKKLGPKYGAKVQDIIKAAKAGEFEQAPDGSIKIAGLTLAKDEMEILYVGHEGLPVESVAGLLVALDTKITPELELEGNARDLVRQIQELRKEAQLDIADRIELHISGLSSILRVHGEYVRRETLATSLVEGMSSPLISKSVTVAGEAVTVSLSRVG